VDSLCSAEGARLGRSVQFSDTGLYPAQADHAKHLDAAALGVPVIAAGIPTLMMAQEGKDLVVTPRELDSVIAHGAALLGAAINRALQPRLSIAQLCWLVG
jgi:spore protease